LSPTDYNNPRVPVPIENHVTVNGERRAFPAGTTLIDLVAALSLPPERVAIELNRAIVKRELWPETAVDSGAEIEIVQFVGGG
jgi:sulfur carrier protein